MVNTVKRLLVIVAGIFLITSSEAYAQAASQQKADRIGLSGPRAGVTFLSKSVQDHAKENFNKELNPVISQFGWQWEKQFLTGDTGATAVTEWVLLFGGADQGVFIPSLTWLLGMRTVGGVEIAAGPNLSPMGMGVAIAGGVTLRAGNLNVPLNVAVVPSSSGVRFSFLMGFNSKRN